MLDRNRRKLPLFLLIKSVLYEGCSFSVGQVFLNWSIIALQCKFLVYDNVNQLYVFPEMFQINSMLKACSQQGNWEIALLKAVRVKAS